AEALRQWGGQPAQELEGQPENVTFSLPKALRIDVKAVD
ncbi:MAG: 4-hydroxy-3-methylbut-2-enyl diphosphate reductase, partial [Proteobacteria bacterium]|nr:4-hydroxy-3-methylbut-2-enyl diphosphate reductase [Pseudomonadota bacterium]